MDGLQPLIGYAEDMIDYARQSALQVLSALKKVTLASDGPAGLQVGEYCCRPCELMLLVLIPNTSDHLFNLEHAPEVILLAGDWELVGKARVGANPEGDLLGEPELQWYTPVHVEIVRMQKKHPQGWGNLETIDLDATK